MSKLRLWEVTFPCPNGRGDDARSLQSVLSDIQGLPALPWDRLPWQASPWSSGHVQGPLGGLLLVTTLEPLKGRCCWSTVALGPNPGPHDPNSNLT